MYKVTITWSRTEKEEMMFETREEAELYVKDVIGPGTNSHAEITEC